MSRKAVIVCGAEINNYEKVKKYLSDSDYFIYCDSGLKHLDKLEKKADLIVGDFDSHEKPDTNVETIVLPREKDDTDSVFAMKEALKRGFEEVLFIGAAGRRLDHTLVNVYALLYLYENGKKGMLVDDYSEMLIVGNRHSETIDIGFPYFSLVALSGEAKGVSIKGAKLPLEDGIIAPSYQYATSNEVKGSGPACVSVKSGHLLLTRILME